MDSEKLIERTAAAKREQLAGLPCWDANIWLGRPAFFPLAQEVPLQELGPLLARYGCRGALVSHWDSVHLSAQDGNQALLDSAAALPDNVYTIWTGLPTMPREQSPLPGTGQPDLRLRGVRLFPQTHHFDLSPWVLAALCEWCGEHHLPLFLWHVEIRWSELQALAAAFPRLKVVIETQWQKILYQVRNLFSLLKACPNVLVESSNLVGQDHVSYLVRNFGSERLLYGSFLPMNDPYAAIGLVLDADISVQERENILGKNLERLIAEVRL
jgi:hypothetical protein